MSFQVPEQESVDRSGYSLPEEGRQDVAVTHVEATRSSKGDPMMVMTLTIDNGKDQGVQLREYFAFKPGSDIAWSRLACLCDAADFKWGHEVSSLEAFCAQFPTDGSMRFSVDVEVSYSVKVFSDAEEKENMTIQKPEKTGDAIHEVWLDAPEHDWEDWPGDKNARAQVRQGFDFEEIYQPAQDKQALEVSPNGQSEDPAFEEETFEEDDKLPF